MSNGIRLVRKPESEGGVEKKIETPQSGSVRAKYWILGTLIVLSFALASVLGYQWYVYSATHISTDNASVENDLLPVNSRMMGFVKDVLVEENSVVHKGDVMARFDDQDVQIELAYKRARFHKADMDFGRAQNLVKSHAISPSDFELAETAWTMAKADLDGSELKHAFTEIKAASDGVVAKKSIQPGQFVQPGQTLFMIVAASNPYWIRANFKETQISKIKPGMKVDVTVDAFPDVMFEGSVLAINPSTGSLLSLLPPENATGNFTKITQRFGVKIALKSIQDLPFKAGMSAKASIAIGGEK